MPGAEQFFNYVAQQGTQTIGHDPSALGNDYGLGPLGNMAIPMLTSGFMSQNGLYPGQFFPSHNFHDQLKADRFRTQQAAAMSRAMQDVDVSTWLDTTAGMSRMMGLPFGLNQAAAHRQMYTQFAASPMMSMLAQQAPELVDSLHGSRGSAALLASNLMRGGQYRLDQRGYMGMDAEGIRSLTQTIDQQLYSSPKAIAEMRGIGMGQLGQIFDEAQRRGHLPGSISARSQEAQIAAISRDPQENVTAEALRSMDEGQFGERLRQFDSRRVTGRLKELAGAVSAMKELFGANGQPNAPMSQIITALESITQNKLANMSGAQVEGLVRKTKSIAEVTGLSLDSIMHLTAQAGAMGDSLGMDRSLAINIGQGSAMHGSAYKNAFGSSFTAFGAASAEEVQMRDNKLRTQAAMSETSQFAGAFLRSVESLGVNKGSEAERLATAIRNGETSFVDKSGQRRSMLEMLTKSNLSGILQNSGVDASGVQAFQTATRDTFGNQEYIQQHGLERMSRRLQGEEISRNAGRIAGEGAVIGALTKSGMGQEQAAGMAKQVGGNLLSALLGSEDPEALSSAAGRRAIIQKELAKTMGEDRARQLAPSIALDFESRMNQHAQRMGYGDLTKMLQSQSNLVLQQEARTEAVVKTDSEISGMLSKLGKAGPIQRVMDMIQAGKSDEDITKAMGVALGGVDIKQVHQLMRNVEEFRAVQTKTGPRTAADMEQARKAAEAIRQQAGDMVMAAAPDVQRIMGMIDEKKSDEEIKRAIGEDKFGSNLSVQHLRSLKADRLLVQNLESKTKRTDAENKQLEEAKKRIEATTGRIIDSGMAGDMGRQVGDEDIARMMTGSEKLELIREDKNLSPEEKASVIGRESNKFLKRSNNIIQALYMDTASQRRLGEGGTDLIKKAEGTYAQLLRAVGGDQEMLTKILSGDPSITDEKLKEKVLGLHEQHTTNMQEIQDRLKEGSEPISDEKWVAEQQKMKDWIKQRGGGPGGASDAEQTEKLLKQLTGKGYENLSDEEKKELKGMMGGYGDTARADLMMAVEARDKLLSAAKEQDTTVAELSKKDEYKGLAAQAGGLLQLSEDADTVGFQETEKALKEFQGKPKGATTKKLEMTVNGSLTVPGVGVGQLTADAFTNLNPEEMSA